MTKRDDNTPPAVFFTDGHVVSKSEVLVAAKLSELADEYFSRVFLYKDGNWVHADIEDSVHSVTYNPKRAEALFLGSGGTVTSKVTGAPPVVTEIPDAERMGNLNRIRTIGGACFVCGYGGQFYERDVRGTWRHMDEGMLEPRPDVRSVDLLDTDGSGSGDICAVGTGGAIFQFDGERWSRRESGTNVHLTAVRYVQPDELYVAGYNGTVLRGAGDVWEPVDTSGVTNHIHSIEVFEGVVYAATHLELLRLEDGQFAPVEIEVSRKPRFSRLHANDGVLWSFGLHDLVWFDGRKWHEVVHPDNAHLRE